MRRVSSPNRAHVKADGFISLRTPETAHAHRTQVRWARYHFATSIIHFFLYHAACSRRENSFTEGKRVSAVLCFRPAPFVRNDVSGVQRLQPNRSECRPAVMRYVVVSSITVWSAALPTAPICVTRLFWVFFLKASKLSTAWNTHFQQQSNRLVTCRFQRLLHQRSLNQSMYYFWL